MTITVHDAAGGSTAVASPNAVTINAQTVDWVQAGPVTRRKILIHELFHVLQYDVLWIPNLGDPSWLVEGSAEYVGYASLAGAGLMNYDEVKRCQTNKYFDFNAASLPELDSLSMQMPGAYAMAWLAVDRLVGGPSGIPKFATFWRAGTDSHHAFQVAFGPTMSTFTSDFKQYRRTLVRPEAGSCSTFNR